MQSPFAAAYSSRNSLHMSGAVKTTGSNIRAAIFVEDLVLIFYLRRDCAASFRATI